MSCNIQRKLLYIGFNTILILQFNPYISKHTSKTSSIALHYSLPKLHWDLMYHFKQGWAQFKAQTHYYDDYKISFLPQWEVSGKYFTNIQIL